MVVTERRGPAFYVGIDRPDKHNALDAATVDALHRALDDAAVEPCVLVMHSTTPGMFVSGADVAELRERDADAALLAINAGLFDRVEAHRWPTIAAIDGHALGGGCELALACDHRVASTRSVFGQPELSLGILAGAGANWRLPQLVGIGVARRMLYTGERLGADDALRSGLIDQLHEPGAVLDAAAQLAATMAERSWRALELTKLALRLVRPTTTSFDVVAQALLFESDDKRRRMDAFLTRRAR